MSNLITNELEWDTGDFFHAKKIRKFGNQIERYAKNTQRFFENFERMYNSILSATTPTEFKNAVATAELENKEFMSRRSLFLDAQQMKESRNDLV